MSDNSQLEVLRGIYFLEGLDGAHLEQIASISELCDFQAGQTVFREGDAATYIYLIVFGNVSLEVCAAGVGCKRILTAGPGEMIGWSALIDQARLTATARTLTLTQLVKVDAAQLLTLCEHNLRFGYVLMRRAVLAMGARLNATRIQLLDIYGAQMPAAASAHEASDGR
jgi:CRP-like cAMP-binding protein